MHYFIGNITLGFRDAFNDKNLISGFKSWNRMKSIPQPICAAGR